MLTSDPRIVPNTMPVTELTFEEATELAYFGAQVCRIGGMHLNQETHVSCNNRGLTWLLQSSKEQAPQEVVHLAHGFAAALQKQVAALAV